MLAVKNRITRQDGFGPIIKGGSKAGNDVLVVSLLLGSDSDNGRPARAGIIVGKRHIPRASARNRVKRRLRHLLQPRLSSLPADSQVVIRALSNAADLSSEELAIILDRLLAIALRKASRSRAIPTGASSPQ